MNEGLFNRFLESVNGKEVLEIGLKVNYVNRLKSICSIHSFDISTSALRFNKNSLFKQNSLVKLPFIDEYFDAVVSYRTLGYGDSKFLFNEIRRVSKDMILICEDDIDSLPLDYFMAIDDIFVDSISTDGEVLDVGKSFAEFFSRRDLKRLFYKPGGNLNKFNLLIPEDVYTEIGILCSKNYKDGW